VARRKERRSPIEGQPPGPPAREARGPGALGLAGAFSVFAVALATRGVVALQLASTALYREPQLDQLEYLIWARGLVERGFSWPAVPTKGPGYAAFLAGLLGIFDGSLGAVRVAQAFLGAGTCLLVALLATRLLGDRRAGVAAGLLLAAYGPLVWIDTMLLAEGLFLFLLTAALSTFTLGPPAGGARGGGGLPRLLVPLAFTGLLLGLAALVRATALALVPAFGLLLLLGKGPLPPGEGFRDRRRWLGAGVLVGAALAVVLPVTLAMAGTTGSPLLIQGYGGLNLFMGNQPGSEGLPSARLGGDWDRLNSAAARAGFTTAAEQDHFYAARAREAIAADPLGWLGTLGRKLIWFFQAEEVRESHSYAFFRQASSLLGVLPGFALLFPLAVWGLVEPRGGRELPWALPAHVLVVAATCVGIIMGSRYRLPAVPVLAVWAGAGVLGLWAAARQRRWRRLAAALAVLALAFGLTQVRRHGPSRNLAEEWALTSQAHLKLGERGEAEAASRQALAEDPASALAWDSLGRAQLEDRQGPAARESLARAVALNPDYATAHFDLARADFTLGRRSEAAASLRRSLTLSPDFLPALELLAPLALSEGSLEEADGLYRRITELAPGQIDAWLARARIAGARGRPGEGIAPARQAAERAPQRLDAWMLLATLAFDAGDGETAARALERVRALAPAGSLEGAWGRALELAVAGRREDLDAFLRQLLTRAPGFAPAAQLFLANATALGREGEGEAFLAGLRPGGG